MEVFAENKSFPDVLFKLCKPEHNLERGCKTLRVGSFQYYWQFENKDIGDLKEGIVTLRNPTDLIVSGDDRVPMQFPAGGLLHLMQPNTLIFSLTSDADVTLADYSDGYSIDCVQQFGQSLAMALFCQLKMSDFMFPDFPLEDLHRIDIRWYAEEVVYVPDQQFVINANFDELTSNPDYWNGHRIELIKRSRYSAQKEVRYVFRVVHPRFGVLHFRHKFFDVALPEEFRLLTSVHPRF